MVCTYEIKQKQIEGTDVVVFFVATLATLFCIDLLKIHFASKLKKKLTPKAMGNISIVVGLILVFMGLAICFSDLNLPPNEVVLPLKTAPYGG